jgi:hypothetical protein
MAPEMQLPQPELNSFSQGTSAKDRRTTAVTRARRRLYGNWA